MKSVSAGRGNQLSASPRPGVLLINRELGVADNVEKEHMCDLELNLLLNFHGHGGGFYSVASEGSTSFFTQDAALDFWFA